MDSGTDRAEQKAPLWRDRSFGIFWGAQTLSVAGDAFAAVAVPLLVLQLTGSVARMGLLTAAAGAAAVLTAVFAGVVVDRVDRRTLLIRCDLARAALYAIIPAVWLLGGPQLWLLYAVLPLSAAVGMLFQVGYVTAVPNLVDADRITEANGRLSASYAVAGIGGPLLAGVVCARFGPPVAIAVDAASFAVSALGLTLVRLRRSRPERAAGSVRAVRDEFLAGARFLWAHPVLRSMTVLLSFFIFLTYGLNDVLIYHVKHNLGGSDGSVGLVLGTGALGTVLGALVVAPVRRRFGFGPTWIAGTAAAGLAAAGAGLTGDVRVLAAVVAGYLCCVTVGAICSMSLRQEVTPDHLLGRVTSAFWAIHFSLGPAGAALVTWGAERAGVAAVCGLIGAGCAVIALAALRTPVRRADQRVRDHARTAGQAPT